jgi:transposase
MGAPGYPPLTMFKILLLQQWHTLSDPGAEEAVRDRLSFRRFCGLPLDIETPDHASIWRFRQAIDKLGLSTKLLAESTASSRRSASSSSAARWSTRP